MCRQIRHPARRRAIVYKIAEATGSLEPFYAILDDIADAFEAQSQAGREAASSGERSKVQEHKEAEESGEEAGALAPGEQVAAQPHSGPGAGHAQALTARGRRDSRVMESWPEARGDGPGVEVIGGGSRRVKLPGNVPPSMGVA